MMLIGVALYMFIPKTLEMLRPLGLGLASVGLILFSVYFAFTIQEYFWFQSLLVGLIALAIFVLTKGEHVLFLATALIAFWFTITNETFVVANAAQWSANDTLHIVTSSILSIGFFIAAYFLYTNKMHTIANPFAIVGVFIVGSIVLRSGLSGLSNISRGSYALVVVAALIGVFVGYKIEKSFVKWGAAIVAALAVSGLLFTGIDSSRLYGALGLLLVAPALVAAANYEKILAMSSGGSSPTQQQFGAMGQQQFNNDQMQQGIQNQQFQPQQQYSSQGQNNQQVQQNWDPAAQQQANQSDFSQTNQQTPYQEPQQQVYVEPQQDAQASQVGQQTAQEVAQDKPQEMYPETGTQETEVSENKSDSESMFITENQTDITAEQVNPYNSVVEQEPVIQTQTVTPNWYPDPASRFEFRWHDGVNWTQHVSTGGQQQVDPEGI